MASLSSSGGLRTLQFTDRDGNRKSIRLGRMPQKAAETIKTRVEELLAHGVTGTAWPRDLTFWVEGLGDTLAAKLAGQGLIPARQQTTLGAFLDAFLAKRAGAKPNSLKNYKAAVGKLLGHFGRDIDVRHV